MADTQALPEQSTLDAHRVRSPETGSALAPSAFRAWLFLIWLSIARQARIRQMVGIALALLLLMATAVTLITLAGRWGMDKWWWRRISYPPEVAQRLNEWHNAPLGTPLPKDLAQIKPQVTLLMYGDTLRAMETMPVVGRWSPGATAAAGVEDTITLAFRAAVTRSPFYFFSNLVVFSVFVGFMLPIWSLSFATEALGGEREGGSLIWLLSRPLPRSSIYLAKYIALLPWSLALNLGGFGLLCLLGGTPGHAAFRLYWPAVLAATLAFTALFHLMGAAFRRAAVIALVYSFFLETIFGSMPGHMKRMSISFYTRCLMFDAARDLGVQPEKPSIYLPVDGFTAWAVLLALTVVLLVVGMLVFARSEYRDLA
jgi:ABC-2 type transport system permease protein